MPTATRARPRAAAAAQKPKLVTKADLESAARKLRDVAVHTSLLPAPFIGEDVWLKPEMLQRGGAFKFRGAYNFVSRLDPKVRKRGVIAPSSGNHAQAVALAAKLLGAPATVVMPTTVTSAKRSGAERLGARIELAGTTTQHRMERAMQLVEQEGATLVPPYDDPLIIAGQGTAGLEILEELPDVAMVLVPVGGGGLSAGVAAAIKLHRPKARIIAGQGTAGLEILEELPDVAMVLVPVGGGGLSAGVAAAIKLHRPKARIIGVEPTGAPKLSKARIAGKPVRLEKTESIADGLLAVEIGTLTFAHHQRYLDDVVLVDDAAMRRAMRVLLDRAKIVAEPSGAITAAAVLEGIVKPAGKTVIVLSGGNIEFDGLTHSMG